MPRRAPPAESKTTSEMELQIDPVAKFIGADDDLSAQAWASGTRDLNLAPIACTTIGLDVDRDPGTAHGRTSQPTGQKNGRSRPIPTSTSGETPSDLVELLANYLNLSHQGERIRAVLAMTPASQPKRSRSPKRVLRQLRASEAVELAKDYEAGASLQELASRHGIHKHTVSAILERQGVSRRYRRLDPHLTAVILAYESGDGLATIAARYGVNKGTVRQALVQAGVSIRPLGWNGR